MIEPLQGTALLLGEQSWGRVEVSNPAPEIYKIPALPDELTRHIWLYIFLSSPPLRLHVVIVGRYLVTGTVIQNEIYIIIVAGAWIEHATSGYEPDENTNPLTRYLWKCLHITPTLLIGNHTVGWMMRVELTLLPSQGRVLPLHYRQHILSWNLFLVLPRVL